MHFVAILLCGNTGAHNKMTIISHKESRQILRNLYRKEVMEKYAEQLRNADLQQRSRILAQIDREVEERVRRQIITGH